MNRAQRIQNHLSEIDYIERCICEIEKDGSVNKDIIEYRKFEIAYERECIYWEEFYLEE